MMEQRHGGTVEAAPVYEHVRSAVRQAGTLRALSEPANGQTSSRPSWPKRRSDLDGRRGMFSDLEGRTTCRLRSANTCWLRARPASRKSTRGTDSWPSSGRIAERFDDRGATVLAIVDENPCIRAIRSSPRREPSSSDVQRLECHVSINRRREGRENVRRRIRREVSGDLGNPSLVQDALGPHTCRRFPVVSNVRRSGTSLSGRAVTK